jgi:hypothetical protein
MGVNLLVLTLSKYGNRCVWCRSLLIRGRDYKELGDQDKRLVRIATVDHILPKSYGGTDHLKNLRPCCTDCNGARGSGWKDAESDTFPLCPLLIKFEKNRPSLCIKLMFPESVNWISKWKDRLTFKIELPRFNQENE